MGILDDKKLLITGVLTDASLAFSVARLAQEQGAEIILTGAGRGMRLTQRTAKKLFDMFGKTASLCEPRETQLIKLERILASAKAKGKCNDLDKVEQDVLNALNFMNFHYAALDLNFALGGNDVCGEYFIELNNLRETNSKP